MADTAREAETKGTATVEFRGKTFTINTAYREWTVDLLESIEEGKSVGIVRGALGPQQWAKVKAMNLQVEGLEELADKIATALGFKSSGE